MSDYRRGLDWRLALLTTYTLMTSDYILHNTDTQTSVLSLLQSPLAVAGNGFYGGRSPYSGFPNYPCASATSF
jgi:hypothetical protein